MKRRHYVNTYSRKDPKYVVIKNILTVTRLDKGSAVVINIFCDCRTK